MPKLKIPAPLPSSPVNAFDVFYAKGGAGQTPANAVRLAKSDHVASNENGRYAISEYTAQLDRAARILDAFEAHRFAIQSALDIASGETSNDAYVDAKDAFINAVA